MANYNTDDPNALSAFLSGRSETSLALFDHFIEEYQKIAPITLYPAKTMIGISNGNKRVAWVTQFGKSFLHVVFPFKQPYNDNLCFQKIAQVPDDNKQYNHHFRMLQKEDVNEEVREFMKKAWKGD
jgi:hypothetical protein